MLRGCCVRSLASAFACAQVRDFPSRPVRIVVPSAPGAILDLVALAKAKPGALSHSSGGYGTNIYIMGALFKHLTGTDMLHVPYKSGGQALAGVVSGEAGITFFAVAAVLPLVNAGKLRALAITSRKRSAVLPKIPTLAEAGVPGYEFTSWVGILAPGTTPSAIIDDVERPRKIEWHRCRRAEAAPVRTHHAVAARKMRHPTVPREGALCVAVQQQYGLGLRPRVGEIVDQIVHLEVGGLEGRYRNALWMQNCSKSSDPSRATAWRVRARPVSLAVPRIAPRGTCGSRHCSCSCPPTVFL